MSQYMVGGSGGSGGTVNDPTGFQQNASNDLFNLGDCHSAGQASGAVGSWTSIVEMDLHGQSAATTHCGGWTQQVDTNVVVIDNHSTSGGTPGSSAVCTPSAAAPSTTDPAHSHINTVHW